jgi:uncharacterized protein YaaN involved in tellurite resistance
MRARYDKAEGNIGKICEALESHQVQLLKDISMLDQMYELKTVYFRSWPLPDRRQENAADGAGAGSCALSEKARLSGLPEDAQAANDLASLCNRFEKKLHDWSSHGLISIQKAPQIAWCRTTTR